MQKEKEALEARRQEAAALAAALSAQEQAAADQAEKQRRERGAAVGQNQQESGAAKRRQEAAAEERRRPDESAGNSEEGARVACPKEAAAAAAAAAFKAESEATAAAELSDRRRQGGAAAATKQDAELAAEQPRMKKPAEAGGLRQEEAQAAIRKEVGAGAVAADAAGRLGSGQAEAALRKGVDSALAAENLGEEGPRAPCGDGNGSSTSHQSSDEPAEADRRSGSDAVLVSRGVLEGASASKNQEASRPSQPAAGAGPPTDRPRSAPAVERRGEGAASAACSADTRAGQSASTCSW